MDFLEHLLCKEALQVAGRLQRKKGKAPEDLSESCVVVLKGKVVTFYLSLEL